MRELPYDISGLDPWLMEESCFVSSSGVQGAPRRYRGYEQYDLVLHGWLSEIKGDWRFEVLARTEGIKLQIPLFSTFLQLDDLQSEQGRGDLATKLVDALSIAHQEGRLP